MRGWLNRPQLSERLRASARAHGIAFDRDGRVTNGRFEAIKPRNAGGTTTIYLYHDIGMFGVSAADFARTLQDINGDIDLRINSYGGEIYDGIAILNLLRAHRGQVSTTVDGIAASAASFILQAGTDRACGANAEIMIHDGIGACYGPAHDMRSMADQLDRLSDNIAAVYAERSGQGTVKSWRKAMQVDGGEGTWYAAREAKSAGLVDRVLKVSENTDDESDGDSVVLDPPWYSGYDKLANLVVVSLSDHLPGQHDQDTHATKDVTDGWMSVDDYYDSYGDVLDEAKFSHGLTVVVLESGDGQLRLDDPEDSDQRYVIADLSADDMRQMAEGFAYVADADDDDGYALTDTLSLDVLDGSVILSEVDSSGNVIYDWDLTLDEARLIAEALERFGEMAEESSTNVLRRPVVMVCERRPTSRAIRERRAALEPMTAEGGSSVALTGLGALITDSVCGARAELAADDAFELGVTWDPDVVRAGFMLAYELDAPAEPPAPPRPVEPDYRIDSLLLTDAIREGMS